MKTNPSKGPIMDAIERHTAAVEAHRARVHRNLTKAYNKQIVTDPELATAYGILGWNDPRFVALRETFNAEV
jgi:hypothetical protein